MQSIEVEIGSTKYTGTYRVVAGSVIVYLDAEIKFAAHGTDRPEVVATWLLRDLCLRAAARRHKRDTTQRTFERPT